MTKPHSRILVIEDEPLVLREIVKGLNAAARSLDNPLGISFSGVATAKEALAAIAFLTSLMALRAAVRMLMLWARSLTAWRARLRADLMLAMCLFQLSEGKNAGREF